MGSSADGSLGFSFHCAAIFPFGGGEFHKYFHCGKKTGPLGTVDHLCDRLLLSSSLTRFLTHCSSGDHAWPLRSVPDALLNLVRRRRPGVLSTSSSSLLLCLLIQIQVLNHSEHVTLSPGMLRFSIHFFDCSNGLIQGAMRHPQTACYYKHLCQYANILFHEVAHKKEPPESK